MQSLACLLLAGLSLQSSNGEDLLLVARAVVDHQEAMIQALDAEFEMDILARSSVVDVGKPVHQLHRFREQRRGAKFYSDRALTIDLALSTQPDKLLQTYDGEKFFSYDETNRTGGIYSDGTEPTCLAQTLYLSPVGLSEMLRRHADVAQARWVESKGQRLLAVSWDEADGATHRTYYLDPDAAYQPRRYTMENEYPEGYYPDGRKRGTATGMIKEYYRRDGIVFPTLVELTDDEVDAEDRVVRMLTKVKRVTSLKINPELDDSVFTIEFPKGTRVKDKDRGVRYIVGQPGSEEPLDAAKPVEAAAAVDGPSHEFWADWRVWVCFSVVCLALLIWVKRKGIA